LASPAFFDGRSMGATIYVARVGGKAGEVGIPVLSVTSCVRVGGILEATIG
jgi:hypothetical protein